MDKKSSFGLPRDAIEKIHSVLEKHQNVEEVLIYGSRAKGNYKSGSDIDLVLVGPALSLEDLLKIETELDDLLLPYKVDLSLLQQIDSAELLDHIKRVGTRFYPADPSS